MILSRRSFLKVGLIGAATLTAAGGLYRATRTVTPTRFVLDGQAASALTAITEAILKSALPAGPQAARAAVARVQHAIAGLPLTTQMEIQDLFGLLTFGPTRRLLAGIPDEWSHAKPEDVAAFLQSWRTHRIGMLQSAYHALHDLISGSWYADESSWASIGYPGPIKI
jgi:hypothetical protein